MPLPRFLLLSMVVAFAPAARSAGSGELLAGPVEVRVVSVLDGDTFRAEAHVWPGHHVTVNVRIRGIDAPEMKSRCDEERDAARAAREALAVMLGETVRIANIAGAKYYGRVLADVATADGAGVADTMLGLHLVRRYDGGRRDSWCG
ncbi:MAG: thermonuclease family protein [Rhizobiaceae bacterium]